MLGTQLPSVLRQTSSPVQVTPWHAGWHAPSTQVSVPLHETPSAQSGSTMQTRDGQPSTRSHVEPTAQRVSSGSF